MCEVSEDPDKEKALESLHLISVSFNKDLLEPGLLLEEKECNSPE